MKYILNRIDGEYAYLSPIDSDMTDELFIAMALLPLGVDIGSVLIYEDFEFKTDN
jgi:hypothetical protein